MSGSTTRVVGCRIREMCCGGGGEDTGGAANGY